MFIVIFAVLFLLVIINIVPLRLEIKLSTRERVFRVFIKIFFFKKALQLDVKPKITPTLNFFADVIRKISIEKLHLDIIAGTGDAFESTLFVQFLRNFVFSSVCLIYKKLCKSDLKIKIVPTFSEARLSVEFECILRLCGYHIISSVLKNALTGKLIKKEE